VVTLTLAYLPDDTHVIEVVPGQVGVTILPITVLLFGHWALDRDALKFNTIMARKRMKLRVMDLFIIVFRTWLLTADQGIIL